MKAFLYGVGFIFILFMFVGLSLSFTGAVMCWMEMTEGSGSILAAFGCTVLSFLFGGVIFVIIDKFTSCSPHELDNSTPKGVDSE